MKSIDVQGISEANVQATIELQSKGLQSIENPTTKILVKYFGEYLDREQSLPNVGRRKRVVLGDSKGSAQIWICAPSTTGYAEE